MKRESAVNGFIWTFLERVCAELITFFVSVILARKLGTGPYGIVALSAVFINLFIALTGFSLAQALIHKKNADELDYNTVFYFSIVMHLLAFIIIFFLSGPISNYYNEPILKEVLRFQGLIFIAACFPGPRNVFISKNFKFKLQFFTSLPGTIISAIIGIVMAFNGFGVWSLVAQQLIDYIIDTIILCIVVKWKPRKMFSFARLKELLKYSYKIWLFTLLDTFANRLQGLVIGKQSTNELALYNRGENLPSMVSANFNSALNNTLLPAISEKQDKITLVRNNARKIIKVSTFCTFPMMVGLFVVARPLITVLYGSAWIDAVPYLLIFCSVTLFLPLMTLADNILKGIGKSGTFFIVGVIKKSIIILSILVGSLFGVFYIAIFYLISTIIAQIINMIVNKKVIDYKIHSQLSDISEPFVCSVLMGIAVYSISNIISNDIILLIAQVFIGIGAYVSLSFVFQKDSLEEITNYIGRFFRRKNNEKEN